MIARVSPDDLILYANGALARYLGVTKEILIGAPLEIVQKRLSGEMAGCFERPEMGRSTNRLVADDGGRVFELKTYSEGGVLDIVLDEVTDAASVMGEIGSCSGTPAEELDEDELRILRYPERRLLSITSTRLCGLSNLAGRLAPSDVRLMVNSFLEEAGDAVIAAGSTVGSFTGYSLLGIYGAPRYHSDHPLRAIQAACDQLSRTGRLREGLSGLGKELPPVSVGIATGDALVGMLGDSQRQCFSAVGATVDLADRLARLARPGEVLLAEATLLSALHVLPPSWESVRASSESEADLSGLEWGADEIQSLPPELKNVVYLLGPGVSDNADLTELYFDYLYCLKVPGQDEPVPVLRVVRPHLVGSSLELNDERVVVANTQALGKYRLIEIIGQGGMGKVWRAVDRFGNAVAIKVLNSAEAASDAQLKRFRREAEVMARLPHRNICRVYEMNEFEGIHYIAMEFVDGLTLSDLLYEEAAGKPAGAATDLRALIDSIRREKGSRSVSIPIAPDESDHQKRPKRTRVLPVEQTLSIFGRICDAVQFAHEHGVLHRDLKPGNILLREDGEPLVADFGLAKIDSHEVGYSLSISGHVVGTLENMSPEQAESSKDVDERADVYSLGTILYQMLTGQRHFEATGNIVQDAQALQVHMPTRPRQINPALDADLEIITLKALRNDPAERYRNVAALHADLDRYRRGEVISAKPINALELARKLVQRNRTVSAVIFFSLLVLAGGGALSVWKILERTHVAERQERLAREALVEAERQRTLAEGQKTYAEEQRRKAEEKELEVSQALAEVKLAQSATKDANQLVKDRENETAEERKKREEAERLAQEKDRQLQQLQASQHGVPEPAPKPEIPKKIQPRVPDMPAAQKAFDDARFTFNMGLSPQTLKAMDREPEKILARVGDAIDSVSKSLLADGGFFPGWMLKGRLHLASLEIDRALACFDRAISAAAMRRQDSPPDDNPRALADTIRAVPKTATDRSAKVAAGIGNIPGFLNKIAADTMVFMASKSALKRSSATSSNPLSRPVGSSEAWLEIASANGLDPATQVQTDTGADGNMEIAVEGAEKLSDLSILHDVKASSLAVRASSHLDWTTIASLPVKSLVVSGCDAADLPTSQRGYLRLEGLDLSDTPVRSLDCLRSMVGLESLNLSKSGVSELTPLMNTRKLSSLNLAGLQLHSLQPLKVLPLESLVISPELLDPEARADLEELRTHRTLRLIRSPEDPEKQTAAEFWGRYDGGAYKSVLPR